MANNAVIYCRVSTVEQAQEGTSLATQERLCREYADRHGLLVERVFVEEGQSAKTINRPQIKEAMRFCEKNRKGVDILLIYRIDRLSRNMEDFYLLKTFFRKTGTRIVSASEPIEDTPTGRFIENVLAGNSQLDNDVRSERCRNGMVEAVKDGRFVWRAPVGYKNATVAGLPNLVIDEPKAAYIRRAFDLVGNKGMGITEAAVFLAKTGFTNRVGKPVSKNLLSKILHNQLYCGRINSFGMSVEGTFTALIDAELFRRTQSELTGKDSKNGVKYVKQRTDFPLRGLLMCSCGRRLTASWSKGRSKKYPYYRCTRCRGVNRRSDILEAEFSSLLSQHEVEKDFTDMLKDAIVLNWEDKNREATMKHRSMSGQLSSIKLKRQQVIDKNLSGVIDDETAKEIIAGLRKDSEDLERGLTDTGDSRQTVVDVVNYGMNVISDMRGTWAKLPLPLKQRLQTVLFPGGVIFDGKKVGTGEIALILQLKETLLGEESLLVAPRERT